MNNFKTKTVDEWFDSVGARRDWCYKPERKVRRSRPSIEFLHDDSKTGDSFDKNRASFLRELDALMN